MTVEKEICKEKTSSLEGLKLEVPEIAAQETGQAEVERAQAYKARRQETGLDFANKRIDHINVLANSDGFSKAFAKLVAAVYENLVDVGFSTDSAFTLTRDFVTAFLPSEK